MMQAQTLDGHNYNWNLPSRIVKGKKRKTSQNHANVRDVLKQLYPNMEIYEEVPVQVEKNTKLFLDFFIPMLHTAVEIHGEQHYAYSTLFHKSRMDFLMGQAADRKKAAWCELNGIKLITLSHAEEDKWIQLITN